MSSTLTNYNIKMVTNFNDNNNIIVTLQMGSFSLMSSFTFNTLYLKL